MLLKGKTAVVTGCNRGIGLSILETFSKNGAQVVACVRKIHGDFNNKIEKISDETGNKIDVVVFDLENETEIEQGISQIKKVTNSRIITITVDYFIFEMFLVVFYFIFNIR